MISRIVKESYKSSSWSGRTKKNFYSKGVENQGVKKKGKAKRWLGIFALVGGSLYIGDLIVNDDFDQLTNKFRRKLSEEERKDRPKVLILGTGWGSLNMLRKIHCDKFDVTVVSPRNYFLFTPLLPSTSSGTVSVRSIMEPIRNFLHRFGTDAKFIEVEATEIDPDNKVVHCEDTSQVVGTVNKISLEYDYLVVAVGAETATFNVPGVADNAVYMRSIDDAQSMRQRILDCFETSMIPGQPEEEIRRLLHFVVVGGGPSGVECTAELYDFIKNDLRKSFPSIASYVKISLVEALPSILPMFDRSLISYVEKRFQSTRSVDVLTKSAVTRVDKENITVKTSEGEMKEVPYGILLWVAGNAPRKIVRDLMTKIGKEQQPVPRGLNVDEHFRVKGLKDVYAIGDASFAPGLAPTAQVAAQEGTYLARLFNENADLMYKETLKNRGVLKTEEDVPSLNDQLGELNKFKYNHYGSFAYVGDHRAIADLSFANHKSSGFLTFLFWRSVYVSKLLSTRNRFNVLVDWTKSSIFGRDISRG